MMNIRTIRGISCLLMAAGALLLSSCQLATPASRIEQNPQLYAALSDKDKALVQQGQIRSGMTPDAVFLAWGHPNTTPFQGEKNGKRVERWVYTRSEPVTVMPAWDEPCLGADGCYHYHNRVNPETLYVPRNVAEVVFENGKVVSWEARF